MTATALSHRLPLTAALLASMEDDMAARYHELDVARMDLSRRMLFSIPSIDD